MPDNSLSIFNSTLPTTTTTQVTDYDTTTTTVSGLPSYININISNGGLLNGVYDAWCVNSSFAIVRGTYNTSIYSSYGVIPTGILLTGQQTPSSTSVDPYLDKLQQINWILNNITETSNLVNNKYRYNGVDYTWGDVQLAIWQLLGETNILDSTDYNSLEVYSQENANNLVSLAQANGSNFVPVAGQDFGVIVKADGQQPIILEVKTAGIGDFVWEDLNANGIQDANEAGINGATVKLLDANGNVVGTTTTGDNPYTTAIETGYYQFGPLLPGTYKVQFTLPTGYNSVSPYLQGSNFTFDSDANPANNFISQPITLVGGQVNNTIDAGFYKFASIGDFVWEDKNGNSVQDVGEGGIAGVNVTLTGAGADGVIGTADDTTVTTTTDAAGQYSFTGLTPGVAYQVRFTTPTGFVFTNPDQGTDDRQDSDVNIVTGLTPIVTLSSGEFNDTLDAGLVPLGSIGDTIFFDRNNNGLPDAGEGLSGVKVNLDIDNDGSINRTVTTNANGTYLFSNLSGGNYKVIVDTTTLPLGGLGFNNTVDPDGGNNNMSVVTLPPGGSNLNLDFGYQAYDYGDAPNSYGTLLTSNGARHLLSIGQTPATPILKLGNLVDTELNGQPSLDALGDNNNNLKDEDGVQFGSIAAGQNAYINVSVVGNGGVLNAWVDFNKDGDWNDPGEQIFTNKAVVNGNNKLSFAVPDAVNLGETFARFRLSTEQNLTSTGTAKDGEVEDYKITINDCPTGPIGGINLGNLTDYLFFFANGSEDANWQGASKGFVGNVAVDGIQAKERTSGDVPYAGTIYTNDSTLGAWQKIVDQNLGQAAVSTGETARISGLENDLNSAFTQINGLTATPGFTGVSATALNGLNTQDGIGKTYVINVTSGFQVSSKINITGDADDVFVLRWDSDANFLNGYQGQVKFQSGGAIVPLGGLKPSNFIHVAGDINASGGGSNPLSPYPQGPRYDHGAGDLINGGKDFSGGGFFTGYWLTTGAPGTGDTSSLSNAIFVGGWYTLSDKFSLTSGTSGIHICPTTETMVNF